MAELDTTLEELAEDLVPVRVGDAVHDPDGTVLGTIDRAVVTPDLRHVSHVGVQPVHHYEWPRLVPVTDLERPGPGDQHVLVRRSGTAWPGGYETADLVPGMREDELPDHPRHPVSGLQQFFMALLSPGLSGGLGVAARMRERLPEGHTALHEGARLMEWDEYHVARAGEIRGLLVAPDGQVVDVLVAHRHGLRDQRIARVPIDEVEQAGVDQARTALSRDDLDRYDVSGSEG